MPTFLANRPRPFYGWAIILVGALTLFSSGPGQTFIFSVFIESLIEDTGLSRPAISTLYAVGTGLSAFMVFIVARLADRYGARTTLIGAATGLGLACLAMSQATGALMVFLAFSALRALGQGSMTINGTLLAAQWFVRRRGRAMAVMGLGFPISVAILPTVSRLMIDSIGWREAYIVLGIMVWVLVLPGAFFIVRNKPEDIGLHPDGADHPPLGEPVVPGLSEGGRDTRRVLTSLNFWLLALPVSSMGLVSTGLVFHQTAIAAEQGLSAVVAASIFVPYAITDAGFSLIAGDVADRFGPKVVLIASQLFLIAAMAVALIMDAPSIALLYGFILGIASGTARIAGSVTWAHFYGRAGLGRVQGAASTIGITASALGPMPLAWLNQLFDGFGPGIIIMGTIPALAIVAVILARPPNQDAPVTPEPATT